MLYRTIETPIGPILLAGRDQSRLALIALPKGRDTNRRDSSWTEAPSAFAEAARQLEEYFRGERTTFELDLDLAEGTDFQQKVWWELAEIPYGETISYGELARRLGKPKASRAVGAANGKNPLSIVLPCHRVIGSDGSLTGYGGGLDTKRFLLELEGARDQLALV